MAVEVVTKHEERNLLRKAATVAAKPCILAKAVPFSGGGGPNSGSVRRRPVVPAVRALLRTSAVWSTIMPMVSGWVYLGNVLLGRLSLNRVIEGNS